jgi:exodeoxyribonuclease-3
MKVMTLNVLLGGGDRMDALCEILVAERPDLLALEECVGWCEEEGEADGARLAAVAQAIGVPADPRHTLLGAANRRPSGRRHHIALLSRAPIARSRVHASPRVAHCIVEAELDWGGGPLVVLAAHLHANDEDSRLVESDELLAIAPPEAVGQGAYILCGDLNSLTRQDPYPGPTQLDERLARAGVHKYSHPPRFDVMDRLLSAGWIDALCARPRSARWATARRGPDSARVDTRTDYVLLSPSLAGRLVGADVIDVGGASDHHAVIAELG